VTDCRLWSARCCSYSLPTTGSVNEVYMSTSCSQLIGSKDLASKLQSRLQVLARQNALSSFPRRFFICKNWTIDSRGKAEPPVQETATHTKDRSEILSQLRSASEISLCYYSNRSILAWIPNGSPPDNSARKSVPDNGHCLTGWPESKRTW
jgi:hypothetical protein